jgi:L-glyceraldehyde 3-phosphate reductase
MTYVPADDRYKSMTYRRCGRSGLQLPAMSLGLWHNFGDDRRMETQRATVRRAFDRGITHFDLANNYGPPYGAAETNFGRILREDLATYRNELVISTKAGWDMWLGPYGDLGSRKYLLASLDDSLQRLGLDYVDIFYSHRFDPHTPLEETMGALDTAVRQGKALYVGISSYGPERTREAAAILADLGTPLLIHQPSYSMLNRWIEPELLDVLEDVGAGCIGFTVLAQGLLTGKYRPGQPPPSGSRATSSKMNSFIKQWLTDELLEAVQRLRPVADEAGLTMSQLALAWVLHRGDDIVPIPGTKHVQYLEENVRALEVKLSAEEMRRLDDIAPKGVAAGERYPDMSTVNR